VDLVATRNLPSGLKSLSLSKVPHLANPTDWQLAFLPASITSLDLSLTDIVQVYTLQSPKGVF
jgi:hypothetical protein